MRIIFLFLLLFISTVAFAQQLKFTVSKYDVFLNYYNSENGSNNSDTFHYDSNFLLTDEFSIYEHSNDNHHPVLKGKFKNGKLIDSLFAFQNEGQIYMRGYFVESNLIDTFSYLQYTGHTNEFRFPGIKSGKFIYYQDRTLEKTKIENYLDGKLNGEVIGFYDGIMINKYNYRNGMRNGTWYFYFNKSPIIKREWNYCNDTLCGTSKEWYSKDSLFQVIEYKKSGEVSKKQYYKNGNIWLASFLSNTGKKDSTETEWYENGQLLYLKTYKSGLLKGKYEEYYSSGQIKIRSTYLNDSLEGKFESWHENGKMAELGYFTRGDTQKGYKRFDENGRKNGEWSNYGNRSDWGYGYPGVIDGVYTKENWAKHKFNYQPTTPEFENVNTYTKKEKRLLSKYDSLQIEMQIFDSYSERFYHSYAQKVVITSKIKESHRVKIENIIRFHLQISDPFMVGEIPASSVLHGVIKFE